MTDPIIKHYNLAVFRAGSLIDPDNHERIILLTFIGGGHMFTKLIGWSGRFLILAHDHPLVHWKLDNEGNRHTGHFRDDAPPVFANGGIKRLDKKGGQPQGQEIYRYDHDSVHERAVNLVVGGAEGHFALEKKVHRL